ncbi:MAG: efflux transporter outer membrane subunit [Puniceicoccales bacterium]
MAGCATKEIEPPVEVPGAFSQSGTAVVPDRWWTAFNDPGLDEHMERALAFNLTLEAAWERLQEAQAVVNRESAAMYPNFDAVFDGDYSQVHSNRVEGYSFGLVAEYEVDLWGRIRSLVEAEEFRSEATFYDYQTAALTLSAEVARTYFQLVESQNQRDLLHEQIRINENVLSSLKTRFGAGLIRSADILRQEQLIEATREQIIVEEATIGVLENKLAVLQGRPPEMGEPVQDEVLPELPPMPNTGLPAALVQRRPDVQSAYSLVRAANADLAAAITNQYPRLTLSASLETAATNPSDLFGTWVRSIAGQVVAPIFDAGRRASEVERNEAVERRRVLDYGQSVLVAFQEVEDSLVLEQKQIERITSIRRQLQLSRSSYNRLQIEYFNGITEYLDVLTALIEEQRLQRDLLLAHRNLLEFRIGLYRALAGGFLTDTGKLRNSFNKTKTRNTRHGWKHAGRKTKEESVWLGTDACGVHRDPGRCGGDREGDRLNGAYAEADGRQSQVGDAGGSQRSRTRNLSASDRGYGHRAGP